jgi:long-chain acyl-CoA synthetase
MAIRIADDGEILMQGDLVFTGYWNNDEATKESFTPDGWFKTGDIGHLDDDGYLFITGRKKELIVTAAGKNVAPAVLEDRLRAHPLVSQCIVVGDSQPYIAALVTIDPETFDTWKADNQIGLEVPLADLLEDERLIAAIQDGIDDANAAVSHAEAIKRFRILDVDFTEGGGELTPTLKLKRNVVLKQYADDIEALYT